MNPLVQKTTRNVRVVQLTEKIALKILQARQSWWKGILSAHFRICFPREYFSHNTDILRNSEFFFISVGRPRHPPSKMPVTKYYYPDVNLTLTAKYTDNKSLANGMEWIITIMMREIAFILVSKTRFEEKNVQKSFSNRKFCQAHQIGQS